MRKSILKRLSRGVFPRPSAPTDIPGLQLWLDSASLDGLSDGDPVATWTDSSGQGHDFSQSNAASRPTLRRDAWGAEHLVYFDGTGPQYLDGLHSALQLDPRSDSLSVFAVVYQEQGDAGTVVCWRDGSDVGYQLFTTADTRPSVSLADDATNSSVNSGEKLLRLGVSTPASESGQLFIDGVVELPTSVGSSDSPSGAFPVRVGARGDGSGGTAFEFTGFIGEVVIYDRELTLFECQQLDRYFRYRWLNELTTTPNQLPGLWQWYSAESLSALSDGDPVDDWPDSGPEAISAAQVTASNQPVFRASGMNGQPYVEFDGADLLELSEKLGGDRHTALFVLRGSKQDHSSLATLMINGRGSVYFRASGDALQVAGAPADASNNRDGTWIADGEGHTLFVRREGDAEPSVLDNGAEIPLSSGSNRLTDGDPQIGSSASGFLGEVYEIVVFRRLISDWERRALERWISNRYDISFA